MQASDEELEDWADRMLTLANKALKTLPEKHMNNQAVVKFCQGCIDKEAGHAACNARPKTMDKAKDHIRWYQYTHQAIYRSNRNTKDARKSSGIDCDRVARTVVGRSRSKKKKKKTYWDGVEWESDEDRRSVSSCREEGKKNSANKTEDSEKRFKMVEGNVARLEDNMARVLSGIDKVATEVSKLSLRRTSRSPSPAKCCFFLWRRRSLQERL